MTITTKDSILKKWYEYNGQQTMFGYHNLEFKTINHPTPHRFVDLCPEFKLKKTKTDEDIPSLLNIDELLEKKGFNIALAEYSGDNNIIIFAEK